MNHFESLAQFVVMDQDPQTEAMPLEVVLSPEISEHFQVHEDECEPLEGQAMIVIDDLPGAPKGTKDPEVIEVKEDKKEDDNDLKGKYDLGKEGHQGFINWVHQKLQSIPQHSGTSEAGCARAIAYLEKLQSEISKAMRTDLDGVLDANDIERVSAEIEKGIEMLEARIDKIEQAKRSKKQPTKKSSYQDLLVKEAQKITGVSGVMVTVPLLISRIGRICINGQVSGGHSISDLYNKQVKKWKLSDREQAELQQFIEDCGYGLNWDRLVDMNEDLDPTSSDNGDWGASFTS